WPPCTPSGWRHDCRSRRRCDARSCRDGHRLPPAKSGRGRRSVTRAIIEGRGLTRSFTMPAGDVTALGDVSIRVETQDYVAITGPSGCGKSTLLHILGCVDQPSAGSLVFEGRDVSTLSESERSRIR